MKIKSIISLLICSGLALADEGMWTFDNLPLAQMKAKYGWAPDQAWLDNVRLSSIRFPNGSGSFVSSKGLVLTNQHIVRGVVNRVSSAERDLVKDGFVAASMDKEIKIPNYELRILVSTRDVTSQVKAAVAQGMTPIQANTARRERLEQIRSEMANAAPAMSFDSVTLYQGGEYWIYGFKKFDDVRLVAVPELQVAEFGGSHDNYTFPRWCLDYALLRVYENGEPYRPENYLPWTKGDLKANDLVIVSGHPGTTFRHATLPQMEFARDFSIPTTMRFQEYQRAAVREYGKSGDENAARAAREALYSLDNQYKRIYGQLRGLTIPANLARVAAEEKDLRDKVMANPEARGRAADSWSQIENAVQLHKELLNHIHLLNNRGSTLLGDAIGIVRWAYDSSLPADQRPHISDQSLVTRRNALERTQNINLPLDLVRLQAGIQEAIDLLGANDDIVKTLASGKSAAQASKDALESTAMINTEFRKQLLDGGHDAVVASTDPLIVLARNIEAKVAPYRKRFDEQVTAVNTEHAQRIAEARFTVLGKTYYPDATSTLRLSYGPVATYPANGTMMQPFTTFHGLIDRHEGWGGNEANAEDGVWALPKRWLDRLPDVDLKTPFNFAYACDTVGGNSGSPVVNTKGELLGVNFDSNFEGQLGYYLYDGTTRRSIAVDARAITESLIKIMDGKWIADELMGRE